MLVPTQKPQKFTKTTNGNAQKTHCNRGHEFNEENTYINPKSKKRTCRICDRLKDQERYNIDPESAKRKNRDHMREWRTANKERDRKNWTELRKRKKEWLDSIKTPCVKCGEADLACLDFHHLDSTQKDATVSIAVAHWSIKRLQTEIAKCEIICSNCHRKLHAAERNAANKEE